MSPSTTNAVAPLLTTRVLIIDDDVFVCRAMARALRRVAQVTTVQRAEDAIQLVDQGHAFDAILCDLYLPEMDAMGFCSVLEERWPDVARTVTVMTAGTKHRSHDAFLANRRVLFKPAATEDLLAAVSVEARVA